MKKHFCYVLFVVTMFFCFASCMRQKKVELAPWTMGAFDSREYRNLFVELGYPKDQVDERLNEIFQNLFYGSNKIYFEVGDSMGYVSDVKNNDVRTEGMSYGMMIAVQFKQKDIFDRLWRWSEKHMQHKDGPFEGYFAWSCKTDGTRNAEGPASDGELYYITSLIFASNLWGNETGINYLQEAQNILHHATNKNETHKGVTNLINDEHKLITFVPVRGAASFTDPSYHLPAFYEVWARWANDGRSDYWLECAKASRAYLHLAAHPETGLTPDYSHYDGSPYKTEWGIIGEDFRFDSWRVPLNIALDYSWSCVDKEWQQAYANKFQNFLYSKGLETFVDQYTIDGSMVADTLAAGSFKKNLRHSIGLVATSAAVSGVSTHAINAEFVHHLWNSKHQPYNDGFFDAYYDGLLYMFSFMHLSGNYKIIFPSK